VTLPGDENGLIDHHHEDSDLRRQIVPTLRRYEQQDDVIKACTQEQAINWEMGDEGLEPPTSRM
jgi:hypothetical protein